MRILTLTQPWATLMAVGAKLIETRSWGTKYRGPVAIHASKAPPILDALVVPEIALALGDAGYKGGGFDLPRGAILAVVDLVDVWPMVGVRGGRCAFDVDPDHPPAMCICGGKIHDGGDEDPPFTERERAFGDYRAGRWAWITDPARRFKLAVSFKYRGGQGLRNLVPDVAGAIGWEAP